jgi:hypothetical protein
MIAKQIKGSDFRKVLNYVHNKSGARLIGGNMVGKTPASLTEEFRVSANLKRTVTQCVYHVSLSVSPREKLSESKWIEIARAYLAGMEFNGNQYAIYRHTDKEHDHIHIITSRIRITDGSVVSDYWNYRRSETVLRQLEQEFELFQTSGSRGKSKRSPSTGEMRRQKRTGEVNKRTQIQNAIAKSLEVCPSLEEFIRSLTEKGISVRLRKSREGKIEGISYGLDGVAFQGRQLGRDYSWTHLETVLVQEASQSSLIPQPEATVNLGDDNQEKETDEREQEKMRLRAKYISLAAQVRQFPEFQFKTSRVIDVGVILRSLKAGNNLGEAKLILTQCDRVRQWHEDLPRDDYLRLAREYIREVAEKAIELIQKHGSREKSLELN